MRSAALRIGTECAGERGCVDRAILRREQGAQAGRRRRKALGDFGRLQPIAAQAGLPLVSDGVSQPFGFSFVERQ